MASSRLPEREVREERSRTAAAAAPDPRPHKHSALIIVGRTAHLGARAHAHISSDIHRGFQSWDVDPGSCDLNLHLQEFLSHHTASFKGTGQTCLRHSSRALDTQVLIGPSQEQAHAEVLALLSRDSSEKLLILTGQSVEESGDLLFHQGHFSPRHLRRILTEQSIDEDASNCAASSSSSVSSSKLSLTLSCPNIGGWRAALLEPRLQLPATLHINPPEALPAMEALGEFTSLISASLSPPSTFELLPPPTTVGFLKLSRPCCYVFPAGRGDCAFFAVNGFTMLVDGGSDAQACFWRLVRHLDRVDAVLLTHVGTENLPGVNAFLERKVAELELRPEVKEDSSKRLISPELGVVFFNAPSRLQVELQPCVDNVLKSTQQAALTLQLLKKLDIRPQPMFRPQGVPIEPLTLFQKMGVGQLDLYILSPGKSSPEYQTFMQNWPDSVSSASKSQSLPLAALASVSALLVWHPACPQEKVVRVLFPGVTPQTKLLEGLEKLKGLAFLQKPTVTGGDVEKLQGEDRTAKRTDSQESSKSQGKDATSRHGKEKGPKEEVKEKGRGVNGAGAKEADKSKVGPKQRAAMSERSKKGGGRKEENGAVKQEQVKKESVSSKPKSDSKTKLKKEARNDSNAGAKKSRKPPGNDGKRSDAAKPEPPETPAAENPKKEPDEADASKTSTPEDMTADFLRLQEEAGNEKIQGGPSKAPSRDAEEPETKEVQGPAVDPASQPAKVVGFPLPLSNGEDAAPMDLTPTEYTLLDGALRHSPPSRASPENQAPVSPEEATVEQTSPDSRPNSAGHTPYCLSPDDVWCDRATLGRMQAQVAGSEPEDARQSGGPQTARNPPESHSNPKEKQLGFLALGALRDGCSDPSPSLNTTTTTTTTTTHSMPAEVSSPQSTEVDESLSMSFEQGPTSASQREGEDSSHHSHSNGGHLGGMPLPAKKPARSSGSEMGRPPAPGSLHFETSPHEVDLCLVSPCEFKHFKAPDSSEACRGGHAPPHHHAHSNTLRDTTPSDSNAPVCTEDCPSTTADGALDSDEDESCSEPTNSPLASQALPPDPLPAPLRDSPPLPPHPDTSMPVPQSESDGKRAKAGAMRGKKTPAVVEGLHRSGSGKNRTGLQGSIVKGTTATARTPSSSARSAPAKPPSSSPSSSTPGSKTGGEVSVYVDLAYIPSGASCPSVSVDFFRCVRSSCYIISGDGPERTPELMRQTLDALLDGKMCWSDATQVTVIPTFESVSMQEWYQHTLDRQRELGITVLGSNSTVAMQDETFPACKIEF